MMKKTIALSLALLLGSVFTTCKAYMSSSEVRAEADFLTDKMIYELHLQVSQVEAIYEINHDFYDFTTVLVDHIVKGDRDAAESYCQCVDERCDEISYVLNAYQYDEFLRRDYFVNPFFISPGNGYTIGIHIVYPDDRQFFFDYRDKFYLYHGQHFRRFYSRRNGHSYYAEQALNNGYFNEGNYAPHDPGYRQRSIQNAYYPRYSNSNFNYNRNTSYNNYRKGHTNNGSNFGIGNGAAPNGGMYGNNNGGNNNGGIGNGATPNGGMYGNNNGGNNNGAAPNGGMYGNSNGGNNNGGIGNGATPNGGMYGNNNGGIGNGATPNGGMYGNNSGIGSGASVNGNGNNGSIGRGATPNNNRRSGNRSRRNTRNNIGSGAAPSNSGIGSGATPSGTASRTRSNIGSGAAVNNNKRLPFHFERVKSVPNRKSK